MESKDFTIAGKPCAASLLNNQNQISISQSKKYIDIIIIMAYLTAMQEAEMTQREMARMGGYARARKLSKRRRRMIARKAAHARAKSLSAKERSRIAAMGGRAKAKNRKEKS